MSRRDKSIADQAREYVRARVEGMKHRDARNAVIAEHEGCWNATLDAPRCFESRGIPATVPPREDWCGCCTEAQPHHEAYRAAVTRHQKAMRKMRALVLAKEAPDAE